MITEQQLKDFIQLVDLRVEETKLVESLRGNDSSGPRITEIPERLQLGGAEAENALLDAFAEAKQLIPTERQHAHEDKMCYERLVHYQGVDIFTFRYVPLGLVMKEAI